MSRLSEMIEKLCPDGVEYRKLGEVCNLVAGSDVPKNRFSEHITDEYSVPVYSNGVEEKSLYGYTDIPAITEPCVTISARGTIGYAALRIKPFFPIIRLICVIPDESINVRFLFHVLEMSTYRSPQTGIPQLTIPMVKKHLVPVPPLPIQNEIVKLLDNFTELTAELTAELQLRKKQYSFYRDSLLNFSRDDAEVEWKTLGETTKSISSGKNKIRVVDGEYPVYGSTGIIGYCTNFVYEHAQILVARVGSVGYVQIADGRYDVSDNTLIVDVLSTINMKYIFYYLGYMNLSRLAHGAGQPLITARQLKKLIIPIPPLDVQQKIVSILDRFDALCHDLTQGLPAEIAARRKQYEYYRDKLLTFPRKAV